MPAALRTAAATRSPVWAPAAAAAAAAAAAGVASFAAASASGRARCSGSSPTLASLAPPAAENT